MHGPCQSANRLIEQGIADAPNRPPKASAGACAPTRASARPQAPVWGAQMKATVAGTLAEKVYARVKADIFEFRLLPGTRFSENDVADRAKVSRTPVRAALYRLARQRFVSVHAKSGWTVRPLDFEKFEH